MESPIYFTLEMPRVGPAEIGRFVCALRRWMIPFCKLEGVTDVAYEAAMVRPGRDDHNTVQKLFGLATEAATTAYDIGARAEGINHQTMMGFWVGASKFVSEERGPTGRQQGKGYSMLAAKVHGWPCDTDDEADSLGILCYYAHKHGIEVPWRNQPCPSPQFLDMQAKGVVRG